VPVRGEESTLRSEGNSHREAVQSPEGTHRAGLVQVDDALLRVVPCQLSVRTSEEIAGMGIGLVDHASLPAGQVAYGDMSVAHHPGKPGPVLAECRVTCSLVRPDPRDFFAAGHLPDTDGARVPGLNRGHPAAAEGNPEIAEHGLDLERREFLPGGDIADLQGP